MKYAPKVALRYMTIPAGVTSVGALQKLTHCAMVVSGMCSITQGTVARVCLPGDTWAVEPGQKKACHAITETTIVTMHFNDDDCQDEAELCERYTTSKLDELIGGSNNKQLQYNKELIQ